jgi:protein-tyrosine kinase
MSESSTEKPIGDIMRGFFHFSQDQVQAVLSYQKDHGLKFGEAAVALGFVKREDVLWALSQQFSYPYSPERTDEIADELVVATNPFSEVGETFRDLRSRLLEQAWGDASNRRPLAVVSTNVGDGKSFTCANLAVTFSQLGGRTLLVDADMRTPRQHEIFGIKDSQGLSSILMQRGETNVVRPISHLPGLFVMPVGVIPPNPLELIQRPTFAKLLDELMMKFDYVIVDTPAAIHGSDARVIAAQCGSAIAVGRKNTNKLNDVSKLVSSFVRPGFKFLGMILNDY